MQLLPTTKHFKTISELRDAISESVNNFKLPYERNDIHDSFFDPEEGTFEVLMNNQKEKILIPDSHQYPFLYRGQQEEVIPCSPSLFRGRISEPQIFIERLRQTEFNILLSRHPVVKSFFIKHNFKVDYDGLAQHYGLKTDMLDLTNDLDIALFFALCSYNKKNDYYEPITKEGVCTAILYVVIPMRFANFKTRTFLDDKISVIGLQPFARPTVQKGFSFRLRKDETFNACQFTFNYTKFDSEYLYEKFEKGKKLWIKDILAEKTKNIKSQKTFSVDTFNQAYENYPIKGISKNKLKKLLVESGIFISTHMNTITFSDSELAEIVDTWNKQIATTIHQIRRKTWREMSETDQIGRKHEFRTLETLMDRELLRLIGNRSDMEEILNQENVHTTIATDISNHPSNTWNSGWQKIPRRFESVKSEIFLKEQDCIIKL